MYSLHRYLLLLEAQVPTDSAGQPALDSYGADFSKSNQLALLHLHTIHDRLSSTHNSSAREKALHPVNCCPGRDSGLSLLSALHDARDLRDAAEGGSRRQEGRRLTLWRIHILVPYPPTLAQDPTHPLFAAR